MWAVLFVLNTREKAMIYIKQGVFRESIEHCELQGDLNSAVQTSSLLATSRADGVHQEYRLQMFCLLNRKH